MSVEFDFQQQRVVHLDLSSFKTVQSGTSIRTTLSVMRQNRIGAILVEDEKHNLIGIFTERDVLLKVASVPNILDWPVDNVMTDEPQCVRTTTSVGLALELMNSGDYRNVPVQDENGSVVGNLSQQAMITFLTDHFPRQIYNLPPVPEMIPTTREGA